MKTGYRALLLASGMIGMALPALAQPASLLGPLTQERPAAATLRSHHPFLAAAHDDVVNHRWSAAENELERSETVLLNGGVRSSSGVVTSPSPTMPYVIQARVAVKQRDQVDALLAIDKAMSTMFVPVVPSQSAAAAEVAPAPQVAAGTTSSVVTERAVPMVTKALLPGHWQLVGWQYHWVPADSSYRSVQTNPYIPGHYEYLDGDWIRVPGHYANPEN